MQIGAYEACNVSCTKSTATRVGDMPLNFSIKIILQFGEFRKNKIMEYGIENFLISYITLRDWTLLYFYNSFILVI